MRTFILAYMDQIIETDIAVANRLFKIRAISEHLPSCYLYSDQKGNLKAYFSPLS